MFANILLVAKFRLIERQSFYTFVTQFKSDQKLGCLTF